MTETVKKTIYSILIVLLTCTGQGIVICSGQDDHMSFEPIVHNHCQQDHDHSPNNSQTPVEQELTDYCGNCDDIFIVHELIKPVKIHSIIAGLNPLHRYLQLNCYTPDKLRINLKSDRPSSYHQLLAGIILLT